MSATRGDYRATLGFVQSERLYPNGNRAVVVFGWEKLGKGIDYLLSACSISPKAHLRVQWDQGASVWELEHLAFPHVGWPPGLGRFNDLRTVSSDRHASIGTALSQLGGLALTLDAFGTVWLGGLLAQECPLYVWEHDKGGFCAGVRIDRRVGSWSAYWSNDQIKRRQDAWVPA